MALLVAEPYARYSAIADVGTDNDNLTTQWTIDGAITLNTTGGAFGGRIIDVGQNARDERIRLPTTFSGTTIIVGARVKFDGSGSSIPTAASILRCTTSAPATHWQVSLGVGGNLYIFSSGGTTLVGTVMHALQHDVWHYLEVKCNMTDTGSLTIRVDGVQVFTISSTDFQNGSAAFDSLYLGGNHDTFSWEDPVIMDGSGSTMNDFQGDMRFECTVPDANGATVNWTASAGTNVSCIDDALAAYNDDTDYISSGTLDQINMASHGAISASGAATVFFAALFALARSDTSGDNIALLVDSGGTVNTGGDQALIGTTSTAYRWRKQYWTTDPNTSAAWTVTNINAAEWGVKKR